MPTRIVNAPEAVLGVLDLRGVIVPVIDMRLKFHLEDAPYNSQTVTIVLTVGGRVVGMVVDSVSAVIALGAEQIRPAPEFRATAVTDHLIGIASPDPDHPEQLIILMDIERFMCSAYLGPVAEQASEPVMAEAV